MSKIIFARDVLESLLRGLPELDCLVLGGSDQAVGILVESGEGVDGLGVREDAREDLDLVVLGVADLDLSVFGAGVDEGVAGRA
jgi:hypothetical protein